MALVNVSRILAKIVTTTSASTHSASRSSRVAGTVRADHGLPAAATGSPINSRALPGHSWNAMLPCPRECVQQAHCGNTQSPQVSAAARQGEEEHDERNDRDHGPAALPIRAPQFRDD